MIYHLRVVLGLTQKRLADLLGVHLMTVWRWEAGRVAPHGPARLLLAQLDEQARLVDSANR